MTNLYRRLADLEAAHLGSYVGLALFTVRGDVYTDTVAGRTYSAEEFRDFVKQHPTTAFLPLCLDTPEPPAVTVAYIERSNAANRRARERGEAFDELTCDDEYVREVAAAWRAYDEMMANREARSWPYWREQLRRMGREDVIQAKELEMAAASR